MAKRPFEDEEPSLPPKKPQGVKPMGKTHKILAKSSSAILAILIWTGIKNNLQQINHKNISNMQLQAGERGQPLVVDTTPDTMSTKIVGAITGKEEPKSTVIINPPGQEPAIQVITPDATITADKTGEVEEIIPKKDTKEAPLTEEEAKKTVEEAVKSAADSTLPKEEPLKPAEPREEKE